MSKWILWCALSVFLVMSLVQCGVDPTLQFIQVVPGAQTLLTGQRVQFRATGTFHATNQSTFTKDLTNQVTWASANEGVATIDSSGLATAVGAGSTTITATAESSAHMVTGSASLLSSGDAAHDLTSIAIIPPTGKQSVNSGGETAQYIAIGTFDSSPRTVDLTNQVTWQSSDVKIATISPSGLATANNCDAPGPCVTVITAQILSPSGATIAASSDLSVNNAVGGVNLPSLTVYNVGEGSGTVISDPVGINCGSGAGCTGHFVLNSTVTLTATPAPGSVFGGWSANCAPSNAAQCTVPMNNNQTVGAIFNLTP